jgi:serine beta-lactamase-like protein LACTB
MSVASVRILLVALVAVILVCPGPPAPIAQTHEGRWATAIAASREAIWAMMERSGTPGLSVAVAAGGEIVWSEGFGYADLEYRVAVTPETRFGIGSISKSLTTALVGRLIDNEALDIDAPVEHYLPNFPHAGRGITTRLIAAHLSGIDDQTERQLHHTAEHFDTTREALEMMWNDPVMDEPGTHARYGTGTYTIIAAIVEQVTGQDFLSTMEQQVIRPLGLEASVPNERREIVPHRTRFYERTPGGEIVHAPYYDPSFKFAGAGYLSTAEDLVRFGVAMSGPGFLSEPTWKEIVMPARTTDGEAIEFALGWDAPRDLGANGTVIGKSGGGPGIRGYLALYPECEVVIAMLTNLSRAPVRGELWETVAGAFLEEQSCHSRDGR